MNIVHINGPITPLERLVMLDKSNKKSNQRDSGRRLGLYIQSYQLSFAAVFYLKKFSNQLSKSPEIPDDRTAAVYAR